MTRKYIDLFMWGYQEHFCNSIYYLTSKALEEIGAPKDIDVLLVGALRPDGQKQHKVCVEPEDKKWPLSLFKNLQDNIEITVQNHKLQNMFFSDAPSMRDKPEWIRRDSVQSTVKAALQQYDDKNRVKSFCGEPRCIDDYYVVPVIQMPISTLERHPPLEDIPKKSQQGNGYRSYIHAVISTILQEATKELQDPDPGRHSFHNRRSSSEIVNLAARSFLHTPGLSTERYYNHAELFDSLNLISSLFYERTKGTGQLILIDPDNEHLEYAIRFQEPILFEEHRWVRKVLQMATTGMDIIANSRELYGLGKLKQTHNPEQQDAFIVSFVDYYIWELRCGNKALIRSHFSNPSLPQELFDQSSFYASYLRLFPSVTKQEAVHAWELLKAQIRLESGSMIIIAQDAANEANRLKQQGTCIIPTTLTESLLESVSGIDGSILVDPHLVCHAVGIILDGDATDECTPSRGSRYNSAIRYVRPFQTNRLAFVVSDDKTVDVIPPVRNLISSSKIETQIFELESATWENYHRPRNWLNEHRFYINSNQCERINKALERIDSEPKEPNYIYFKTDPFEVDPQMDDSYLVS